MELHQIFFAFINEMKLVAKKMPGQKVFFWEVNWLIICTGSTFSPSNREENCSLLFVFFVIFFSFFCHFVCRFCFFSASFIRLRWHVPYFAQENGREKAKHQLKSVCRAKEGIFVVNNAFIDFVGDNFFFLRDFGSSINFFFMTVSKTHFIECGLLTS